MATTETEQFVKYACTTDTLSEAFTFVMEHVDKFKRPDVTISSVAQINLDEGESEWTDKFEVAVFGTMTDA